MGLTYGIGAGLGGMAHGDVGFFYVHAAFDTQLLEQGTEATARLLREWVERGITQAELDEKRETLLGQQVRLNATPLPPPRRAARSTCCTRAAHSDPSPSLYRPSGGRPRRG